MSNGFFCREDKEEDQENKDIQQLIKSFEDFTQGNKYEPTVINFPTPAPTSTPTPTATPDPTPTPSQLSSLTTTSIIILASGGNFSAIEELAIRAVAGDQDAFEAYNIIRANLTLQAGMLLQQAQNGDDAAVADLNAIWL